MPDVTKFAGFKSPWSLVIDPSLSRQDKLGGLRTWHALLTGWESEAADRFRLLEEVERALARLAEDRAGEG